jgi:alpha-beta hydrolase superfamily lysophospholipase
MSAISREIPQPVRLLDGAEPFYFESAGDQLFGWLHYPKARSKSGIGVVICKPFGYEAICSHRSLRVFAESFAEQGFPTLRFDYLGTGDSADGEPGFEQIGRWILDVQAAVAELRRRCGVSRVYLLGVRLGAALCYEAARQTGQISGLMLIAPVITGRRYLRELRMTRMAAASAAQAEDAAGGDPGSIEAGGFTLAAATVARLSGLDLKAGTAPNVSRLLVIDGDSMPASKEWAEGLGTSAAIGTAAPKCVYRSLPGLVQMIMTAPQFAKVPTAMLTAMQEWLADPLRTGEFEFHGQRPAEPVDRLYLRQDGPHGTVTVCEEPVLFGADHELFGIATEPSSNELRRRVVILLNAGADYHIGASGMYVGLARTWAYNGYFVLRMDFAGIGDSATRSGRSDDDIFPPAALDDIRAAIDFVRARHGAADITLVGICSGAYHALRAAVADLPVHRVLMVNPQNFFWSENMSIEDVQLAEIVNKPSTYSRRLASLDSLRRLVTGKIDVKYVSTVYLKRLFFVCESKLRNVARALSIRLPNDLGLELLHVADNHVSIVFIFSEGEPGIELLKMGVGNLMKRLGGRMRVHTIPDADHVFSKRAPRLKLEAILSDELYARAAAAVRR